MQINDAFTLPSPLSALKRIMRRFVEALTLAGIFCGAFFLSATNGVAKPDFSRRTKKECSYCHPAGSWTLNDAGQYYFDHKHSLEGYVPPPPARPDGRQRRN
jgi:hypothetical protein